MRKIWSDLHGDMQLTQMPKVGVAASPVGNNRVNIWLYAGISEYPALPKGDKATGADNQQERPRKRNPQRPHARHPKWMKIWSHLHGDMQG